MIPKYHINLFWSGPDGAWAADVPDLQSCSAFGDTPAEIEQAIEAWLAELCASSSAIGHGEGGAVHSGQ
jgi:predicted RNase H-like HicB family nuclease